MEERVMQQIMDNLWQFITAFALGCGFWAIAGDFILAKVGIKKKN